MKIIIVEFYKGNFVSAIEYIEKLSSAGNTQYEDSVMLGRAYLALGKYEEAKAIFERLQSDYIDPQRFFYALGSVKIYYYLGRAYEGTGEREEAVAQYSIFLDILKDADPRIEEVDDARGRLANLQGRS